VLHHHDVRLYRDRGIVIGAPGRELFEWCSPLEAALAPYPDLVIRLSTAWVRSVRYERARSRLPPGLRDRVIGATYHSSMRLDSPHFWSTLTRYEQIRQSVDRHGYSRWLAVDDLSEGTEDWPKEEEGRLVRTDSELGLSDPAAQRQLAEVLQQVAGDRKR
jgi:hypothetical protein